MKSSTTDLFRAADSSHLPRVDDPDLSLLQTSGPALGRDFDLADPAQPGEVVVATSTELVVLARLADTVAAALLARGEALDQVLRDGGMRWDSQLIRVAFVPPEPIPAGPAVGSAIGALQVLRRTWLASPLPVALISEEHRLDLGRLSATDLQDSSR